MTTKRRKCLTLEEKRKIIHEADSFKGSKINLAKKLEMAPSTLQTILKNKDKIGDSVKKFGNQANKRKSLKKSPYNELETVLEDWYKKCKAANVPVNGILLREKAIELAEKMQLRGFSASNGWVDRFKKRNNLARKSSVGDKIKKDENPVPDEWENSNFMTIIKDYELRNIFSVDEFGLFFRMLPDKISSARDELCYSGELSKERLTVVLCCNADGSEKLPPLVIGKYANPHCFRNVKTFPTKYASNKKAWVTSSIFRNYLWKLDEKMKAENRKILLFLDHYSVHECTSTENVCLTYFPVQGIYCFQPFKLGINHSFKFHYRKQLVRNATVSLENLIIPTISKYRINVLDSMHLISSSWEQVSVSTIKSCFQKAGFFNETSLLDAFPTDIPDSEWTTTKYMQPYNFQEYISCDDDVITSNFHSIDYSTESDDGSSDDDDDVTNARRTLITFHSALEGLKTLRNYVLAHEHQEHVLHNISTLELSLHELHENKGKQLIITDFFKREV